MTKETLFKQIDEIFGDCHGGVCYIGKERENQIKEILEKAINYTRCSVQLLCIDKGDDNAITKGYEYKSINADETHYKIVDNYGDEKWYPEEYFKISN